MRRPRRRQGHGLRHGARRRSQGAQSPQSPQATGSGPAAELAELVDPSDHAAAAAAPEPLSEPFVWVESGSAGRLARALALTRESVATLPAEEAPAPFLARCAELAQEDDAVRARATALFRLCKRELGSSPAFLTALREGCFADPVDLSQVAWASRRVEQSLGEVAAELEDARAQLRALGDACGELVVRCLGLYAREAARSLPDSGVAVGVATILAGGVVTAAGAAAVPATMGAAVPAVVAGKGLVATGLAALTPSSVLLARKHRRVGALQTLVAELEVEFSVLSQHAELVETLHEAVANIRMYLQLVAEGAQDAQALGQPLASDASSFLAGLNSAFVLVDLTAEVGLEAPFHHQHPCPS